MLVPEKYFNKLDPSFKKLIQELENNLNSSEDLKNKTNYIFLFSKKYLLPKEYWQILSKFAYYLTIDSFYHFFYEKHIGFKKNGKEVYLKHLDFRHDNLKYSFPETLELLENDISYPHCSIKKCFERYEELSYSLPSKTRWMHYKKMKNLYQRIKGAEKDSVNWLKMLREAEDDEFICHNVEYRLGSNLLDKHLWKLYIEFLRERNPKEMLQIYSKYCRFFIGDSEVKKKYRQEAAEFGPVKVRWENLFDFELMDNKNESSDVEGYGDEIVKPELFEKITSSSIDTVKNLDVVFCDSCFHQHFSFSNPLIRYILDSANHIILRKLYQSCKYFYTKKRVPICYRLEVSPYVIPQESMRTFNCFTETFHSTLSFNNYSMLDKFYVTTVLRSINYESNNSRLLSNIISRFYQCDAKYITISDQNLSFEELQFLIGHGNVIKLDCQNVKIEYSENQPVILEDIMALLPNIKILQLFNFIKSTSNTSTILLNQKFNNKFEIFTVAFSYGDFFDFFDFWHFIKKYGEQKLMLRIFFNNHFDEETVKKFSKIISNCQLLTSKDSKKLIIEQGESYPSVLD